MPVPPPEQVGRPNLSVMSKSYTVSDGTLMPVLEPAEEGGYCVTSPLDPQLVTQADRRSLEPMTPENC